jgi:hypothetical protein
MGLGRASSEKQIPQVVENLESGCDPKEALETNTLRGEAAALANADRQTHSRRASVHRCEVFEDELAGVTDQSIPFELGPGRT